jgi:hypothetical protein
MLALVPRAGDRFSRGDFMNVILEKQIAAMIAHRGIVAKLSVMAVVAAISVALPVPMHSQAPKPADTIKPQAFPSPVHIPVEVKKPTPAEMEAWRKQIVHTPREKANACYQASYPDLAWHEVPCEAIPQKASLPKVAKGVRPDQVGGSSGADFSVTTTNNISEAEGQFDSVTTSGSNSPTSYELQMNVAPFNTKTCNGSTATGVSSVPGCQGWEQSIYSTDNGGEVYIQYWLEQWGPSGATCKSPVGKSCDGSHVFTDGWCPFTLNDGTGNFTDCAINSQTKTGIGTVSIANLNNISLNAFPAGASNTVDDAIATISGTATRAPGVNEFPDLSSNWTEVEFNIFGDGGNAQVGFDPNTTIEVRTSVASGTNLGPGCALQSFTGESNNLTLVATTSNPAKGSLPSLVFTETNAGNPTQAPCTSAISLGDTHVHPFNGNTEYDFQAFGDFLLAEAGPDFMVHTRQVPGPPGYPGTATNTAVAVMMGRTRVAVYLQPARLVIDGKTNDLADGKTVLLPSGVQVTHKGANYWISDQSGNTVIADLVKNGAEALWMNVTVNLGRSPDARVRGLLGNPSDKIDEIRSATGATFKVPVDVNDLYGQYADSWRVDPAKSLFVELPPAQVGAPKKPLTAQDLSPADKVHATTVCKAAGVTNEALLDDCILDTTVLRDDAAVKIFTKVAPPKFVIRPVLHMEPK